MFKSLISYLKMQTMKTIKKRYKVIKDILSQNGFWWNPNTEMIECDSDEIWKNYVAVSNVSFFSTLVCV